MFTLPTSRRRVTALLAGLAVAVTGGVLAATSAGAVAHGDITAKPTIVLVHGAFADSSSWNGVVAQLQHDGYPVVAAANPLRDLSSDSAYVSAVLRAVTGPVILVGHSYGGSVITDAATGNPNVRALVYIAALAPDTGETALDLVNKFPGSTLGPTLEQIPLGGGAADLRVRQDLFPQTVAADVPLSEAHLMAVAQRPVSASVFGDPSGAPAWRSIRSYFLIPTGDKVLPPAAQRFMAKRANGVIVTVEDASHAVLVSRPEITAQLIEQAAHENS